MIVTEITVFVACLAAGLLSGFVAAFLLTLGEGSRPSRAVFDFLTPLALGVVYFFTLRFVASGVFRLYSLVAFLLGGLLSRRVLKAISPLLRRVLKRVIVPIKSLERRISSRVGRWVLPLKRRIAYRRDRRREKRREACAVRAQKRTLRQDEKQKKKTLSAAKRAAKRKEKLSSLHRSDRAKKADCTISD